MGSSTENPWPCIHRFKAPLNAWLGYPTIGPWYHPRCASVAWLICRCCRSTPPNAAGGVLAAEASPPSSQRVKTPAATRIIPVGLRGDGARDRRTRVQHITFS